MSELNQWCKENNVKVSSQVKRAADFLESKGYEFLVDFGYENAEQKAKEKIEKVCQELKAGKDFGLLAEQYSDDYYAVKGGDLGWQHRGQLDPEFEKVAFGMQAGKFSEPFRTDYGYNLMKVEGHELERLMGFDEVRPILKAQLEKDKYEDLRASWIAQLKKDARIEIEEAQPAATSQPQAAH